MEYKTVLKEANESFVEKRSRFIGYVKPVTTEEQAIDFINSIKSKHWDATHNVYAYSLREGQTFRYSDDGEPQGTAGIPVLDVLRKSALTDCVVVVTRYFGGVLLGTGGLVRAYSHSASLAVKAGNIIVMRECTLCTLTCDYNQYGKIQALIPEASGIIDSTEFTEDVNISFHIEQSNLPLLEKKMADATAGTVKIISTGKKYFIF